MKKWETPVIEHLELKDTQETECSCSVVVVGGDGVSLAKAIKHPCHKTGNGWHNDSGNHVEGVEQNGHVLSSGCPDPNHYVDGKPICCCYKPGIIVGGGQS